MHAKERKGDLWRIIVVQNITGRRVMDVVRRERRILGTRHAYPDIVSCISHKRRTSYLQFRTLVNKLIFASPLFLQRQSPRDGRVRGEDNIARIKRRRIVFDTRKQRTLQPMNIRHQEQPLYLCSSCFESIAESPDETISLLQAGLLPRFQTTCNHVFRLP